MVSEYIVNLREQLRTKEQECETLASQLDFEVQKKECLEQECEELKRQLTILNGEDVVVEITVEQFEEYKKLKAELEQEKALKETYFTCYKAKHEDIEGQLFKLKQTLTEIKEIANLSIAHWDIDYLKQAINEILQKIIECEGNDE